MIKKLYIELLEQEVLRLREERKARTERRGAVANMLGVTNEDVSESRRLVDETFQMSRNITSENHEG
jgi:hypothetical protein